MTTVKFVIPRDGKKLADLPGIGGTDLMGNRYSADALSLKKNGKRILPVMGELHYSRVPMEEWREEILKMKAGGIDVLATYVFWNHHEEREGEWDFSGQRNLRAFLAMCKECGMQVWLRIGPWAHGEARHGGFPDFVNNDTGFEKRTNDPRYLELVRKLYGKIAEQCKGMLAADGGPILGIQLENEYGHCGGPADKEAQRMHMKTLLRLAQEVGLAAPYYTATAWGGACTIDETLQVLSGYVDAPWDDSTEALPAMENYLFIPYRDDANTGSDFHKWTGDNGTIRSDYPYLTAELGGGLQVTSHRRPITSGMDNAAHILTVLGSGAGLIGYYMYHGGINPDGKYSTLHEAQDIGGYTTVPEKSYDFDACINEAGQISDSFGSLKKYHILIRTVGEDLAGSEMTLPDVFPVSAEDMDTVRASVRYNRKSGQGYLFINNYVRHRTMQAHESVDFEITFPDGVCIRLPDIHIASGKCYILLFDRNGLKYGPHSFLTTIGSHAVLYDDGVLTEPVFQDGRLILPEQWADRAFVYDGKLYITDRKDSVLLEEDGRLVLLGMQDECVRVFSAKGWQEPVRVAADENQYKDRIHVDLVAINKTEQGDISCVDYLIHLSGGNAADRRYLEVNYLGDRAEVFQWNSLAGIRGKKLDDWFTTGKPWRIKLSRFGNPEYLCIRIYDSEAVIPTTHGKDVYYDIPVQKGCEITGVKILREYQTEI